MSLKVIFLPQERATYGVGRFPKYYTRSRHSSINPCVRTAQQLEANGIYVVYGNGGSTVHKVLEELPVNWIEQHQQFGNGPCGDAAMPFCDDLDQVSSVIWRRTSYCARHFASTAQGYTTQWFGLVVAENGRPTGFDALIRNDVANIIGIVEQKDATEWQRQIKKSIRYHDDACGQRQGLATSIDQ